MNILETRRRDLVAAPLLAMAAMALRPKRAQAAGQSVFGAAPAH